MRIDLIAGLAWLVVPVSVIVIWRRSHRDYPVQTPPDNQDQEDDQ